MTFINYLMDLINEFDRDLESMHGKTVADLMRKEVREKYKNFRTEEEEKLESESLKLSLNLIEDSQAHLEK